MEEYNEPRHAASHDGEQYFEGSIQEAIDICRSKKAFLIVFLEGETEDSYRADREIHTNLARNDYHCIALRLHDDLHNTDPEAFKGAKAFREIFPAIRQLPFFMILGPDGKELACLEGGEIALYSAQAIRRAGASFPKPIRESSLAQSQGENQVQRSSAGSAAVSDKPTTFDSSPSSSRSTSESGSRQASAAPSHHSGSLPTVETPSSSMGLGFRTARQIPEDAFVSTATPWSRKSGVADVGKQSDIGEMGSALLAASQQAAQVAAFHQRNAAWSESVNARNWNHPSRPSQTTQAGRSPSSASSRFGQGSDWSKYFSPIPPLGPPQPDSPARSPTQSTAHSSMNTSPIASPPTGLHASSQPTSPRSSMQTSPATSPAVGGYSGDQPQLSPAPGLADHASVTAGISRPDVAPIHQSHQPWQQPSQASQPTSHSAFVPGVSVSTRSAGINEPEFTSEVSTARQADPANHSSGPDTYTEPASLRVPALAERDVSPRRFRGSETLQPYSPQELMQQNIEQGIERQDVGPQEPVSEPADDFPGTPESQLSEQTAVPAAAAPTPIAEQAEVSSAKLPVRQDYSPPAAAQDQGPEALPDSKVLEPGTFAERQSAEPLSLPSKKEEQSSHVADELGAERPAHREDEKTEVPAEKPTEWFSKEDEKVEVPTEPPTYSIGLGEPMEEPAAGVPHPEPSAEKFRTEPAAENIRPAAAAEAEQKSHSSSRSSPHSSPFSSPASQNQADQAEAIQGLKAAIQHNLDNIQDSSTATSAKPPLQSEEDAVEGGGLNRKLASFGSLAEALPDYELDATPEPPRSTGGFGVGGASETSATAADPSATAAGVPDVNASHTWTPSQEHIIPPSPKEGDQSLVRDAFSRGNSAEPSSLAENLHGDENTPPSSLQTSQPGAQTPHSLAVKGISSLTTKSDQAGEIGSRQPAGPATDSIEEDAEGYIPPSPRDVGLTSRDLDDFSPVTPRGVQTGNPFDDSPATPRGRQTESFFDEDQPDESAAESARDASLAQKAKDEASDAALEEAVDYNKRYGPSKGSDALRAVGENGLSAAIAAQRAKDDKAATAEQPAATAAWEPEEPSPTHTGQSGPEENLVRAEEGRRDITPPNVLAEEKETDQLTEQDAAANATGKSEPYTSYNNDLFKAQPSVDDNDLSAHSSAHIAFRLTNGRSLRGEFSADSTLQEVVAFVDEHRTDGTRPYLLRTPFPYRLLDTSQHDYTLQELDLCPRSVLVLQPSEQSNKLAMSRKGLPEVFVEYVQTYFMALAALFLGFFSGIFGSSDQQAITETTTYHSPNRVQYPSASTKDPATSYKGGQVGGSSGSAGSVFAAPEDDKKPDQNDYYNGNSTEFKGDA